MFFCADALKTKLQFLIELIAPPVPRSKQGSCLIPRFCVITLMILHTDKGKELFDLLSLTEEMEGQLMEMNDLLNLGRKPQ